MLPSLTDNIHCHLSVIIKCPKVYLLAPFYDMSLVMARRRGKGEEGRALPSTQGWRLVESSSWPSTVGPSPTLARGCESPETDARCKDSGQMAPPLLSVLVAVAFRIQLKPCQQLRSGAMLPAPQTYRAPDHSTSPSLYFLWCGHASWHPSSNFSLAQVSLSWCLWPSAIYCVRKLGG